MIVIIIIIIMTIVIMMMMMMMMMMMIILMMVMMMMMMIIIIIIIIIINKKKHEEEHVVVVMMMVMMTTTATTMRMMSQHCIPNSVFKVQFSSAIRTELLSEKQYSILFLKLARFSVIWNGAHSSHHSTLCSTNTPVAIWGNFRDTLWGSKEDLQTTAQFIKDIHLHI